MDLQTIADRIQLPIRKVRYVIDHRLLPGLRVEGQPNVLGRARSLTDFEGFGVAAAALLLESGVKREKAVDFIDSLCSHSLPTERRGKRQNFLLYVFSSTGKSATASLGDGVNVRLRIDNYDSHWLQPRTGARLATEYEPRVVIMVDLARLRNALIRRL